MKWCLHVGASDCPGYELWQFANADPKVLVMCSDDVMGLDAFTAFLENLNVAREYLRESATTTG
jgi:hypothetical protein